MATEKPYWAKIPSGPSHFLKHLTGVRRSAGWCHCTHKHHAGDPFIRNIASSILRQDDLITCYMMLKKALELLMSDFGVPSTTGVQQGSMDVGCSMSDLSSFWTKLPWDIRIPDAFQAARDYSGVSHFWGTWLHLYQEHQTWGLQTFKPVDMEQPWGLLSILVLVLPYSWRKRTLATPTPSYSRVVKRWVSSFLPPPHIITSMGFKSFSLHAIPLIFPMIKGPRKGRFKTV